MVFFVFVSVPKIFSRRKRDIRRDDYSGVFHVCDFSDAVHWEMAIGSSLQRFVFVRTVGRRRFADVSGEGGGQGKSDLPGRCERGGGELRTNSRVGESGHSARRRVGVVEE